MRKLTHKGTIRGCDARTPKDYKKVVFLRETKLYWVGEYGTKYSKARDGRTLGDWPMYHLDLDMIVSVKKS